MNPLRIAHIDTERTWRGGEQQVFSLVGGLEERGHKSLCVVRNGSSLAQKLKGAGRNVFELNPWGEWDFAAAHMLNRKLKDEKIDLLHAHTAHGVALAAMAACGTAVPVVATRRVDFHLKQNRFSRWKHKRVTHFIAISKNVQAILKSDGISESRITVVPSGVDFSRFQGLQKAGLSEMGFPPGSVVIGQVAALVPHKAPFDLLHALALVRKVVPMMRGIFIGDGELMGDLLALRDSLGLSDVVKFMGFREDALRYLAAFDLFCLSSREEGLGTSVLDAMALKIPVVATRAGGIPEMIEDGVTGYLAEPANPSNLADVLIKAITRNGKNRDLLERAFTRAQEFDIQNTIQQTEAVYASVLAHH